MWLLLTQSLGMINQLYFFHRFWFVFSHLSLQSLNRGGMDANENLRSQFSSAVSSSLDVFDAANGSLLTSIDRE